jgi:hypothetical protein
MMAAVLRHLSCEAASSSFNYAHVLRGYWQKQRA